MYDKKAKQRTFMHVNCAHPVSIAIHPYPIRKSEAVSIFPFELGFEDPFGVNKVHPVGFFDGRL